MGLMELFGGGGEEKMRYKGLMDMIDGGGPGRAGQRFEGGGLSDVLNNLGFKPRGYHDRMAQQRPQARPQAPAQMGNRSQPMAPPAPAMAQPMPGGGLPMDPTTPQFPQDVAGAYGKTPMSIENLTPEQAEMLVRQMRAMGIL